MTERWGVLMRPDHPLAARESVAAADLEGLPLLRSAQNLVENELDGCMGANRERLNFIGEYNLLFNAALLVEAGVGCALCFDRLMETTAERGLCFRPLDPPLEVGQALVWKKDRELSKAARLFLERLRRETDMPG